MACRAATKVWVRQRPNDLRSTRHFSHGAQPVVLADFFFRPKNASRFRWMTMKGWRFAVQMRRRSTTSSGFCSSACRPFRVRKIEPVQNAPDRAASQFT